MVTKIFLDEITFDYKFSQDCFFINKLFLEVCIVIE